MQFIVRGLTQELADEVRRTGLSPGYGHPAHIEVARGTGPCRCCLRALRDRAATRACCSPIGRQAMATASWRPVRCSFTPNTAQAWSGTGFPDALRALPLAFEARAAGSRVIGLSADDGESAEAQIERLFRDPQAQWIQLRHAQAGCFIARVDRA